MRFQPRRQHRPGMTSVLAMLYLVLFASLAVGFYAATNTAVQIAGNERHSRQAMLSAESGMEFVRHVLGDVEIPAATPSGQMWTKLCEQVAAQVSGTRNFGGATVTPPSAGTTSWTLPALNLPGGAACSVSLSPNSDSAETVDATITGIEPDLRTDTTRGDAPLRRKIRVTFVKGPRASEIFDFGVASRSAIAMSGSATITGPTGNLGQGSVLSATSNSVPLTMSGSPTISGDFSYTNPAGAPSFGNGQIAGYSPSDAHFADHVHAGARPPEFPAVDTSSFEQFVPAPDATGASVITTSPPSSRTSFTNIRIKANTNPSFAGGSTINGVVFIEAPNQVRFTGNVTVNGVIVVQNDPAGSSDTNSIYFGGKVIHSGVENLPATDPYVKRDADGKVVATLSQLSGSFLLAPKFTVTMTGTTNNVGGTIVTGRLDISGNAGANVKGTVINLEDNDPLHPAVPAVNMTGKAAITIQSSGSDKVPSGLTFGSHFTPNYKTYTELQ